MEAVEDKVGGNNSALAQTIATEHPGTPGKNVQSSGAYQAILLSWLIFSTCVRYSLVPSALPPPPVFDENTHHYFKCTLEVKLLEAAWEQILYILKFGLQCSVVELISPIEKINGFS